MSTIKFLLIHALLLVSFYNKNQNGIHCFGDDDEDHKVVIKCANRFEFRNELKKTAGTCDDIIHSNPMCGKNYTVAYSIHPPYVFMEESHGDEVLGILPDMLKFALDSCCFGCNKVNFIGPFKHFDKFFKDADLVIPVQTSVSNSHYFGHDFIHMLEVPAVSFIGLPLKHDPDRMVRTIAKSILNTYPLFIIALVMALTAGVAIWLLDTWWNESEFPNRFPRGPFEGFWWAFVSMTTVGYGDKSPKGTISRIFAVVWIAVGITIFSMYTASLTSALTSAVMASHEFSLYQRKVAVLNSTTIGQIAVLKENGVPQEFKSIENIAHALKDKTVDAMALDEHVGNFYMDHIMTDNSVGKLTLYKRVQLSGSSYGAMTYNTNVTKFFKTFFESNDDQREAMAILTMSGHAHGGSLESPVTEVSDFFNSTRMMFITLIVLVVITVVITIVGLGIKYLNKRLCPNLGVKDEDDQSEGLVEYGGLSKKDLEEIADEIHSKIRQRIENNLTNGGGKLEASKF